MQFLFWRRQGLETFPKTNTSLIGLNFTQGCYVEFSTELFVTGGEHSSSSSLITYNKTSSRPTFLVDSSVMSTYVTSTIRTLRITASESMTYYKQVLVPGEEGGYLAWRAIPFLQLLVAGGCELLWWLGLITYLTDLLQHKEYQSHCSEAVCQRPDKVSGKYCWR